MLDNFITENLFEELDKNTNILSVEQYNKYVQDIISEIEVTVEGEITELNIWQQKFAYVTLKDKYVENITTSCFAIVFNNPSIHKLKVGDIVQITGRPGIHTKTGRHSLQIEKITKVDEGFYEKKRIDLIKKLEEEGIIDISKKRKITRKSNSIALITAVPSQAYNDFIKIFNSRWGQGRVYIQKAQMQGTDTVKSVISALDNIHCSNIEFDCIVIARGGGSKEDLINFDNEELVRKIFSSKFPVVSAVGHEGDVSITDLVADLRASTPSNAAELITTPDKNEVLKEVDYIIENIQNKILSELDGKKEITERSYEVILHTVKQKVLNIEDRVLNQEKVLQALDFNNILNRGFSIITNNQDTPINSHSELINGKEYTIYLKGNKYKKYKINNYEKEKD